MAFFDRCAAAEHRVLVKLDHAGLLDHTVVVEQLPLRAGYRPGHTSPRITPHTRAQDTLLELVGFSGHTMPSPAFQCSHRTPRPFSQRCNAVNVAPGLSCGCHPFQQPLTSRRLCVLPILSPFSSFNWHLATAGELILQVSFRGTNLCIICTAEDGGVTEI